MCGIAGIISPSKNGAQSFNVASMVATLNHRGPDDHGCADWTINHHSVSLGHTRLSILDLSSAGHQPMLDSTGDLALTFNGEIYNFRELRKELDPSGSSFRTHTDTEVILHAFNRWGTESFAKLRGMFAFALLDRRTQKLYLVRDSLGIKPLYYYFGEGKLLFASEVRAILAAGCIERKIDPLAAHHFLLHGWVGKSRTLVSGVSSLPPAAALEIDLSGSSLKSTTFNYTAEPHVKPEQPKNRAEAASKLFLLLRESVKAHLVSDVPVGLFLSGGIDSTALLALMRDVIDTPPKTFTVIFPDKELDEGAIAKRVAQHFGSEHQEIELPESKLLQHIPNALLAMDQPTMDGVNTFFISEAISSAGVKVALSGLGSDELFAGYPSFRRARLAAAASRVPKQLRAVLAAGGRKFGGSRAKHKIWDLLASDCTPTAVYQASRRLFRCSEIRDLLDSAQQTRCEAPLNRTYHSADAINTISHLELTGYMTDLLLRDTDFMSMSTALEVRVPFVDKVITDYVLALPGSWKLSDSKPKPLLLDAMKGAIPDYAWNRKKMGFSLPFDRWLRTSLRSEIDNKLSDPKSASRAGLSIGGMRETWNQFLEGKVRWMKPWSLYVLMRWCEINNVSFDPAADSLKYETASCNR